MRDLIKQGIPNLLHHLACKLGVMLKWTILLGDPFHESWDKNLMPDLVVNVIREVSTFRFLGWLSGFLFHFNNKCLLYDSHHV